MKYKLVAIDFDGTFLDDTHFKSDLSYFEKLKNFDIEIVFASGRATAGIIELLKKLKIIDRCRYIIGHNGAEIYDLVKKEVIYQRKIEKNLAHNVISLIKEKGYDIPIAIHKWDKLYVNKINDMVKLEERVNFVSPFLIKDISEYPEDIIKIMIFNESENENIEIYNLIDENFSKSLTQARSLNRLVEITAKDINKFTGLSFLLNKLNINKEETIAFGNGENDIEMILNAGLGYAMKNSDDYLLKHIKNVTEYTNNECGVEKELLKILSIGGK